MRIVNDLCGASGRLVFVVASAMLCMSVLVLYFKLLEARLALETWVEFGARTIARRNYDAGLTNAVSNAAVAYPAGMTFDSSGNPYWEKQFVRVYNEKIAELKSRR
jgi:hypothetical protein